MVESEGDSIIIAGGSARARLAPRLSEEHRRRVLLLKAWQDLRTCRTYRVPTRI